MNFIKVRFICILISINIKRIGRRERWANFYISLTSDFPLPTAFDVGANSSWLFDVEELDTTKYQRRKKYVLDEESEVVLLHY